ncbi:membrane cofactor protein isoform X1 [Salmo trutta]|uniref:membrane cofactor protein isoform X1 n=2 Tax=Salmo trutta TaxID=8032 RepID=UPI00113108C0|nr:membrane cofactor protein-like isoform X1 [Salmo trutta]
MQPSKDVCWSLTIWMVHLAFMVPTVQGQNCSKPIPLEESNMVFTSTQETFENGTKASFECATGYVRAGGSRSVTCTAGVWSEAKLTCELRSCGSPGDVINGQYDLSGILFGDRAVAFCNTGYMLVGSDVRNCLDGGWDGRVPVCQVVKCGKPPTIVNGGPVIPPEEEYDYRSVVEYSCEKEFTLVGTKSIVCEKEGEFQPAPPECKMVSCPAPVVENGVRIEGRLPPYKHKSFVTYKCNDGYEMMGQASLTCEIKGWSASIPTCKALPTTTKPPTTTTTTTTATTTTATTTATKRTTNQDRVPGPPEAKNHTWKIFGGVLSVLGVGCIIGFIIYKYKARSRVGYSGNVATNSEDREL